MQRLCRALETYTRQHEERKRKLTEDSMADRILGPYPRDSIRSVVNNIDSRAGKLSVFKIPSSLYSEFRSDESASIVACTCVSGVVGARAFACMYIYAYACGTYTHSCIYTHTQREHRCTCTQISRERICASNFARDRRTLAERARGLETFRESAIFSEQLESRSSPTRGDVCLRIHNAS